MILFRCFLLAVFALCIKSTCLLSKAQEGKVGSRWCEDQVGTMQVGARVVRRW